MNEVREYFKKWGSVCRMYKVGKAIHCHDTLLIFAKNYHEEQVKKLKTTLKNTMSKQDKKHLDEILKRTGKVLIHTMKHIGAENYLECSFVCEKTGDKYNLSVRKDKK